MDGLSTDLAALLTLAGYVIGLGAVTVIDCHGWLGRTSQYWTEATTRTHKVTKPLIWLGLCMVVLGATIYFWGSPWWGIPALLSLLYLILIGNGLYLTIIVSPYLLTREAQGESAELLPQSWQQKIWYSFILSFVAWWCSFVIFVLTIVK